MTTVTKNNNGLVVTKKINVGIGRGKRKRIREGAKSDLSSGRTPRVSRLMALAIRLDKLVLDGEVSDFAEIARLGHVTRARVTQITNLLNLAPDIQEALLFMPRVMSGRDPISERELRPIAAELEWFKQRDAWNTLLQSKTNMRTDSNDCTDARPTNGR